MTCVNCDEPAHGCLCWYCVRVMVVSGVVSAVASAIVALMF